MELIALLGATFIIMLASLVGVIFTFKHIGKWTEANIQYLVAFASGVFLIVAYDLIFEAFEFATDNVYVWASIIFGFLIFFVIERIYPEVHCHHDERCLEDTNKRSARKVMFGDAIHNMGDGILLAPIFLVDIRLGFMATFGILIHELVQEISEFFILKNAGYSTKKALISNFIVSSTVVIGALAGFFLSSVQSFVGPLIGLSAGAFIYILFIDLIPESIKRSHREKKYFNYIAWTLFGILIILSTHLLNTHENVQDDTIQNEINGEIG